MEYEITRKLMTDDNEYLVVVDVQETEYEDFKATIKWDGCIDIVLGTESDKRYLHLCDIDQFIERLQTIKTIAIEQFGEEWE